MSWDRPSDAAAAAVVWSLISDVAKARKDEAREWLTQHMGADAAAVKAVANGETIGRATWVEGKDIPRVVDREAFIQYVTTKFPDEITVSVNTAFEKALLANSTVVGDKLIDRDGEPVHGVEIRPAAPYVSVRKDGAARDTVEALLCTGRLRLDGIKAIGGF